SDNTLFAPCPATVTLLLKVNLAVRVLLTACAWTANPPAVPEVGPDAVTHVDETPNSVTESDPGTLAWGHDTHTRRLQLDRPEPGPEGPPCWGGLTGWVRRKSRGFRDACSPSAACTSDAGCGRRERARPAARHDELWRSIPRSRSHGRTR